MAKKGGVQQLQADISTDEEFERFLERPGLIVMDVYTEWCGPCIGMVGSLRKIKLEMGGDNLQLAIHQKAVNIMFGTNVPRLMKLIASELEQELDYVNNKGPRTFYEITEMQPIEVEKYNREKAAEDRARLAEQQAAEAKRRGYLTFVTDEIIKNMPDMGVTIFGPHIQRDMYKKLMDPADVQRISCKDRRVLQVTTDDLETLHFGCNNPLPVDVWEYMVDKDVLTCLWKANDSDTRPIDEILAKYVFECTKPQPMADDFGNIIPGKTLPPTLPALEVKISLVEDEPVGEKEESKENLEESAGDLLAGLLDMPGMENEGEDEEEHEEEEEHERRPTIESVKPKPPEREEFKIITIPAVWAPGNRRGMASAIYLFYRWHTGTFLPPDPVPEPPHLAIAFEAYKRKDIADACERFKDDILAYGFFTSADPDTAQLITNSVKVYESRPPQVTDKFVLKVAKKTSHALLTLATHGPSHISNNTVIGEKECKKFFPEDYETEGEAIQKVEADKKKKRKKKKVVDQEEADQEDTETLEELAEGEEEEVGEGTVLDDEVAIAGEEEADASVAPDVDAEALPEGEEEADTEIHPPESEPIPPEEEAPAENVPVEEAQTEAPTEQKDVPIEDSKPVAGDEGQAGEEDGGDAAEAPEEASAEPPQDEGAE